MFFAPMRSIRHSVSHKKLPILYFTTKLLPCQVVLLIFTNFYYIHQNYTLPSPETLSQKANTKKILYKFGLIYILFLLHY